MKTFTIEISEEQLRLIRAACQNVLMQELKNPGQVLTQEEFEEFEMIAGMILDVVEQEHEEDTIHGFCY